MDFGPARAGFLAPGRSHIAGVDGNPLISGQQKARNRLIKPVQLPLRQLSCSIVPLEESGWPQV